MSFITTQATSYQNQSKTQQNVGLRMIDMLNVEKGAIVLDLGCGTGYLAKVLSERVGPEGKVVAVDPDGERLKIARETYPASNIEYIQADDKTFPPGQYDLVFSNIMIHWISDKKALMKRVYENIHPQGCFAFTTSDGVYPIPEIGEKIFDVLICPNYLQQILHTRTSFQTASEYKSLAFDTGFKQVSMTILPDYPKWNNLDDYIDSMYGWFQGEFDPTQFDQDKLQQLKREYGSGPVIQSEPIRTLHAILYKQ